MTGPTPRVVAEYRRDFQRIDQWWLEHRGESWHFVPSEAPSRRFPADEALRSASASSNPSLTFLLPNALRYRFLHEVTNSDERAVEVLAT